LWGIHFDPEKGQPKGNPFEVVKFESPSMMIPLHIQLLEITLSEDYLVVPMAITSGNIWVLDNVDR
jgi:hypothetical protein